MSVQCTVCEQFKSVNFTTLKTIYSSTNCNVTRQQDTVSLEHAFVLPFSIRTAKYALINYLTDV